MRPHFKGKSVILIPEQISYWGALPRSINDCGGYPTISLLSQSYFQRYSSRKVLPRSNVFPCSENSRRLYPVSLDLQEDSRHFMFFGRSPPIWVEIALWKLFTCYCSWDRVVFAARNAHRNVLQLLLSSFWFWFVASIKVERSSCKFVVVCCLLLEFTRCFDRKKEAEVVEEGTENFFGSTWH